MSENVKNELPKSLANFLTVTNPDGTARTTKVEPSPLLDRLKTFLPQMQAANATLEQSAPGEEAVVVVQENGINGSPKRKRAQTQSEANAGRTGVDNTSEYESEEELAVNMDLYVDKSLGELVPDDEEDEENDQMTKRRPLVEVLSETPAGKGDDQS